jgi:hypothetical protein
MRRPRPSDCCFAVCGAALALGLLVGCVSEKAPVKRSAKSERTGGPIEEITLLAIPVALNMDAQPGPDGFVIKIYAGGPKHPKSVPIEGGQLEVRMFDGIPGLTEPAAAKPRRTWTFTAQDLKSYEIRTSIGTGYQLALHWEDAKPKREKISVVVGYLPTKGPALFSAPSIIATR